MLSYYHLYFLKIRAAITAPKSQPIPSQLRKIKPFWRYSGVEIMAVVAFVYVALQ
jgi:hypothetical protein